MKICKGVTKQLSDQEVILHYVNENTVSIRVHFPNKFFGSLEVSPDITEEGSINIPYRHSPRLSKEYLIDILIVDDIEFNISILKRLLEGLESNCHCSNTHRKYTIHIAGSGKETLELVAKQNALNGGYRLIIMDCLMPELDGWKTCAAIHQLYEKNEIKMMPYVLAYSAFDSKEDVVKSHNSGMCGHLSKPSTQADLCQEVSKWTGRAPCIKC